MNQTNTPLPQNSSNPSPRRSTLSAAMFGLAILAAVSSPALGQGAEDTRSWTGGFGSPWDTLGNWTLLSGPPDLNDTANMGTTAIATSTVNVSGFRKFRRLTVDTPFGSPYIFRGFVESSTAGTLDATFQMTFNNSDREAAPANTHRLERIIMRTPEFQVANNAVVEFTSFAGGGSRLDANDLNILEDGTVNVGTSSTLSIFRYNMLNSAGRLNINSGGTLRMDDGITATVTNGTTNINSGGSFILSSDHTLVLSGNSTKFNYADSWVMGDRGILRLVEGADLTAQSYIDVGNGNRGTLHVGSSAAVVSGTTFTAEAASDWGSGSGGNATVNILNGGFASLDDLRMGTFDGTFNGTINGGNLTTRGSMSLGGGTLARSTQLTLTAGTLNCNNTFTLENRADLSLNGGTANLLGDTRVRTGATINWSNATVNFAADPTGTKRLFIDAGTVNRTTAAAVTLTDYATIRLQAGGKFNSSVSTVNVNNGTIQVDGTNSLMTLTGNTTWGQTSGTTNVALSNLSSINVNGNLTLSPTAGRTNISVNSGSFLQFNTLTTGGSAQSSVYINVANGRFETRSGSNATLGRGTKIEVGDGVSAAGAARFYPDALTLTRAEALVRTGGEIQTFGPLTANEGTVIEQTGGNFIVKGFATFNPGSFTRTTGGTFTVEGGNVKDGANVEVATGGSLTTSGAFTIDRFARVLVSGGTFGPTDTGTIINNGLMTSPATASTWTGGTLEIINGGRYVGDSFLNFPSGSLVVDGVTSGMEISSPVTLSGVSATLRNGSTSIFSGGLQIGNQSSATVALASNASLEAATLNVGHGTGTGTGTLFILGGSVTTGETTIHGNESFISLESGGTLKTGKVQSPPGKFNWTGGTLELTGGLTDLTNLGGPLVVPGGGTLKGTGSITGNLAFGNSGSYFAEFDFTSATSDQIIVAGTVTLNAAATLEASFTGTLGNGQKYFIVVNDGTDAVSGTFSGLAQGSLAQNFDGLDLRISYIGDSVSGTITGGNDIVLYAVLAVSPYDTWANGAPFDVDANGDGVPNGLAFLLGAANPNAPARALLPTVTKNADGLVMTFRMRNAAARGDATLSIEHSSDLGINDLWTTVAVPDATGGPTSGVTFTITGSDPLEVRATISATQAASGKLFGRLKAENL